MTSRRELAERVYRGAADEVGIELPLERFLAHVEEVDLAAEALLEFGPDLLLAWACGAGDEAAIARLERDHLARTDSFLGRFQLSDDERREHRQNLRIRLLVAPRLAIRQYRGSGPLGAWLRMASIRLAVNLVEARPGRRERTADSGIWDRLTADLPSPELRTVQAEHREVFSAALEAGLRALAPRERTLLRMHLLDGLGIDAIGVVYRVHRSTAARWLITIREKVLANMQEVLALDLRTTTGELRSLVRALRSEVEVSLDRILASAGSRPGMSVPPG